MYNTYTVLVTLLLFTFTLSQPMDIVLNVNNSDEFADTFYIMLGMIISCCKMTGLLVSRKNIGILAEEPFAPLGTDEMRIRRRNNTLCYTILAQVTCACIAVTSLLTDFRKGNLTYREWTPYNYSSEIVFCTIYARQLISSTFGSMVNVACDSLICGLLLHVCCQLEILECRLGKVSLGRSSLRECVRASGERQVIIAVQFVVSTLVVCSNLYQLAKITLNAQSCPLILYTCTMLAQILIFCWYGNEVKLRSVQLATNIFRIEWLSLDKSSKKSILLMMSRASVPIEFSSVHILTMNLDSFVSLLRISYSAYNILQKMQET